jgi:hypothetical protein
MKHTQFPPISDASVASVTSNRQSNSGGGFFAGVMAALHASRRLQAARVIRQHRHLFHQEPEAGAAKRTGAPSPREPIPQIVRETEKPTAKPGARMSFYSKLIVAIVVAGFGLLHFIADGTLRHASAKQPTEDRMPLPNRD